MAADQKRRREADPERFKDYHRKKIYGLPPGAFDRILKAQNGRCAICDTDRPGGKGVFHVDHCHDTGKIRGVLCNGCNVGLGYFRHDATALEKAVRYLAEGGGVGGDTFNSREEALIGD